jgi:hypothetical protein
MRFKLYVSLALLSFLILGGCSGSLMDNTASPEMPPSALGDRNSASDRVLWGLWEIRFEGDSLTPRIEPIRAAELHYDITPMLTPPLCIDCITIIVNSFDTVTRIMDVDVTLKNPTSVIGHDVRGILFTGDAGHELLNPDDWTGLWDIAGGDEINPFKAFAKTNPNRVFAGFQMHMENYIVYIPKPPQYTAIRYAVDASWPGNCREPYSIENFNQEEITSDDGFHGLVTVDVHDWQGDADEVNIYAPLITGEPFTALAHQGGDTWSVDLNNALGALPGHYNAKIEAGSADSGETKLYDFATITITPGDEPFGWARTWGGVSHEPGHAAATDSAANIYMVGRFLGTDVNFDPDGVDIHSSIGGPDAYFCKYDTYGNFQWAVTWGGTSDNSCDGVAVDSSDNIYVGGYFKGADVNFNPAGSALHSSSGGSDIYLSKFDSNGNFQWVRTWGGVVLDACLDIAVDNSGDVFSAGYYTGTVDFDPGIGVTEYTSDNSWDVYVSKFNSAGDFQWARVWGGPAQDLGWAVSADSTGNVYVTGEFRGEDINFNPGGTDLHSSNGLSDIFVSKFNSDGDFQWAHTWGGASNNSGYGVLADNSGNAYVTGFFSAAGVNFDPGGTDLHTSHGGDDIFLSKFNSSGVFQWADTWGGTGNDAGYGLAANISGDIFVSGAFDGTNVNFNPHPTGADLHSSNGGADVFLSRFNSSGIFQWARTWGGPEDAAFTEDICYGVAIDSSGNVYPAGFYRGEDVNFSPDGIDLHSSNGKRDAYLCKFLPDGNW